eukprot:6278762-Lingulodinium_polyedra.AAC.1
MSAGAWAGPAPRRWPGRLGPCRGPRGHHRSVATTWCATGACCPALPAAARPSVTAGPPWRTATALWPRARVTRPTGGVCRTLWRRGR